MGLQRTTSTVQRISRATPSSARVLSRVLVVDDDPFTTQLLRSIAERDGYQVVSVDDGRKAYRLLKSEADFAAAVFNITMPRVEGVDIVRYMKTEKRLMRIPVIIVAGAQGLNLIGDSFAAGALIFLPKPLTSRKLAAALRLAFSSRSVPNQVYDSETVTA